MRRIVTICCAVFLVVLATRTCSALPGKYKDGRGTTWKQAVYDDGKTKVIYAGVVDFEAEVKKLEEANAAYPTREVADILAHYKLFEADNLVAVYLAFYTEVPITVGLVTLHLTRDVIPDCRVVSPMNKKDPYQYGNFRISPRVEKPAIIVVLAPKLYADQSLSAITWR